MLVLGARASMQPFRTMERAGHDIGLQLLSSFMWLGSAEPATSGYYFVDVDDEKICARYRQADAADPVTRCRTSNPITAAMVADFLEIARGSEAAVVVVDVAIPEDPAERKIIETRLAALTPQRRDGPAVILPLYGRVGVGESGQPLFNPDPRMDPLPGGRPGWLHLAPFVTAPDVEGGDGIIRSFPRFVDIRGLATAQPTAAYAAALLYASSFGNARVRIPDPPSRQTTPIIYTAPSLALLDRQIHAEERPAARRRLERQRSRYFSELGFRRIAFGELLRERREAGSGYDPFGPRAVVVLGSSLPTGMDWYVTPVGPMTGSELILNAVRSFSSARIAGHESLRAPSLLEEFADRLAGLAIGALVMTGAWLAIYRIWERTKRRPRRDRLGGKLAIVALFCAGLLGVAVAELAAAAKGLGRSLETGRSVDVLTPMLTLGLDGYGEALKVVSSSIEHGLSAALALFLAVGRRLREASRGRTDTDE